MRTQFVHQAINKARSKDNSNEHCEECSTRSAQLQCKECEQFLCLSCDQQIHDKGARKGHHRSSIHSSTEKQFKESYKESGPMWKSPTSAASSSKSSVLGSYSGSKSSSARSKHLPRIIFIYSRST